jgi:selenocysteine-specific elongation factor
VIVATAGHVDHGKTALVRALTGMDTDRLPEEQRRGLSIEPGFAHADFGSGSVAFVDVPGHERFLRQMIAGVAAVDAVLLVVAADDGPMPQTREHLAVLDLLGVGQGAVVLSKADRVDAARLAAVTAQVAVLLQGTALAGAPVFALSALAGDGLPALSEQLAQWQRAWRPRSTAGGFRLVIDRCFTQTGAGVVVTGTALSGTAQRDDGLCLSPQGLPVRVRGPAGAGTGRRAGAGRPALRTEPGGRRPRHARARRPAGGARAACAHAAAGRAAAPAARPRAGR